MTDPYGLDLAIVEAGAVGARPRERRWRACVRLPWFRALPLSCLEEVSLAVGGRTYRDAGLRYWIDGEQLRWDQLQTSSRYWAVGETLWFSPETDEPLPPPGTTVATEMTLRLPDAWPDGAGQPRRTVRDLLEAHALPRSRWPLGVCTFGLAGELRNGRSLSSSLEQVARIGGFGSVEILGAQLLAGYPNPSPARVQRLSALTRGLGLDPVCYDAFLDPGLTSGAAIDDDLVRRRARRELDIARALGSTFVRLNLPARESVLEAIARDAQDRELRVLVELHAQTSRDREVQAVLRSLDAVDSPHLGLVLDLSCVMSALPAGFVRDILAAALPGDAVEIIESAWSAGMPLETARERLADAGHSGRAEHLASRTYRLFRRSETDWLHEILPRVAIVHGKFFEVTDGAEPAIAYPAVLARLAEGGFDGFLMSEYEGHLWTPSPDTFGQLTRHRDLILAHAHV